MIDVKNTISFKYSMKMEILLTNIDDMMLKDAIELIIDMEENLLIRAIFYNYGAN